MRVFVDLYPFRISPICRLLGASFVGYLDWAHTRLEAIAPSLTQVADMSVQKVSWIPAPTVEDKFSFIDEIYELVYVLRTFEVEVRHTRPTSRREMAR